MKKIAFLSAILVVLFQNVYAQSTNDEVSCWNNKRIFDEVVGNNDLIFEGRILTDSVYYQNPIVCTYHCVLVLKQFKGVFKSDTILIGNRGGIMALNGGFQGEKPYASKGDEAVFFVSTRWAKSENPDFYFISDGDKCGFIKVCDKKDVEKDVYQVIEKATGRPRIVLRKNSCEIEAEKKKK